LGAVTEEEKMNLEIRSFSIKDLPVFVKLLNESRRGSYEYMPITEEEMEERLSRGKSTVLIAEEDGEIVGTVTYTDGYWGEEMRWLAVRTGSDQKSIEDALVGEAEKLVKRGTVFTAVDEGSPRAEDWIRRGFAPSGGLYQMVAKLDALRPVPQVQEDIMIRSMKAGEESQVIEAVNTVFGWERLKPDFVQKGKVDSPPFTEDWVQVAFHGTKVVSIVVAWPSTEFNALYKANRGYLGPAATLPDYRGKGLASALTVRAMNVLFQAGMDTVVLHTSELNVPSVTLLRNLGFQVGHQMRFLKKNVPRPYQVDRNLIDEKPEN
jgi:ribosomal protein S18 acetylase RimI-like enzyme